jgi:hypothetical protein
MPETRTARELIETAARAINVLETQAALTANELTDALDILQDMLSSWSIEGLLQNALSRETFTLVVGQASYTIGTGGDFDTDRPVDIKNQFISDGATDWGLAHVSIREYNDIRTKTNTGRPTYMAYNPENPLGVILLYFVPDIAYILHLDIKKELTSPGTVFANMVFPPGYNSAIWKNLAIELNAAGFGGIVTPFLAQGAKESKKLIKRLNIKPVEEVRFDNLLVGGYRGGRNINDY